MGFLRKLLLFFAVLIAFMTPKVQVFLTRLDMFKDPTPLTDNRKCCHVVAPGTYDFGGKSASCEPLESMKKGKGKKVATDEAVNEPFPTPGFEDVIYVRVPLSKADIGDDGIKHTWGAFSCASHYGVVGHDPAKAKEGVCALLTHKGDGKLTVTPVSIHNFPHLRMAFHPHGLYRTVVGDRPIDGFPGSGDVPQPHEDATQRIYVVNHGFERGGEAIAMFRLVFTVAGSKLEDVNQEKAAMSAVLFYEGELQHQSWSAYRGVMNDLVVVDSNPQQSVVIPTIYSYPGHSLRGKEHPETFEQKLEFPMTLANLLLRDYVATNILSCPFQETDKVTHASVSATSNEERENAEEEKAHPTPSHNEVSYHTSECEPVMSNLHGNGISMLRFEAPSAQKGVSPKTFRFLFAVDFSRHQVAILVAQEQDPMNVGPIPGEDYALIHRVNLKHVIDNLEFDPMSAANTPVLQHQDTYRQFVRSKSQSAKYYAENIRFFMGSLVSLKQALAVFKGKAKDSPGALTELILSIEYDPSPSAKEDMVVTPSGKELGGFRVIGENLKDLVVHDGAALTGTASGAVLRPPTSSSSKTELAVLGSYLRPGFYVCPLE